MPSAVTFTSSPMAWYTTSVFFWLPALIFDLASFSFQVPINASAAKHIVPPTMHVTSVSKMVLAFMSPPMGEKVRGQIRNERILLLRGIARNSMNAPATKCQLGNSCPPAATPQPCRKERPPEPLALAYLKECFREAHVAYASYHSESIVDDPQGLDR